MDDRKDVELIPEKDDSFWWFLGGLIFGGVVCIISLTIAYVIIEIIT
jgi:hypothetical protein